MRNIYKEEIIKKLKDNNINFNQNSEVDNDNLNTIFNHSRNHKKTFEYVINCIDNFIIKNPSSFKEVYKISKSLKSKGIGPLNIYDVSILLYPYPDQLYLHSGVKIGYKTLLKHFNIKYKSTSKVTYDQLPDICRNVKYKKLEDILCVYKNNISEMLNQINNNKTKYC
jgi:hypothetical protein